MRSTFLRGRDHEQHGLRATDHSVMPQLETSASVCIPSSQFCGLGSGEFSHMKTSVTS